MARPIKTRLVPASTGSLNRGGAWDREGQEWPRVSRPSAEGLIVASLRGRGRPAPATSERQRVGPHWTQSPCLKCPSAWRTSADAQARTTLRMPLPTCVHRWLHRGEVSYRRLLDCERSQAIRETPPVTPTLDCFVAPLVATMAAVVTRST